MKKALLFTALSLLICSATALAECKTCGIERREKSARQTVKYPPPPASARHAALNNPGLYRKFPVKKPQTATSIASYPVSIYPEKTVWVRFSNTDVNRIVCTGGDITYIFTSQEKGVVTEIKEDEAYVKFKSLMDPQSGKLKRIKTPTEFYIRCAGETYSFIAKPQAIPTRTIYLKTGKKHVTPPENLIHKDSIDSAVVEVVRSVFLNRIPPSWEKQRSFAPVSVTRITEAGNVRIKEIKRYHIPGVPIVVRVFAISSKKPVQIGEKLLLDPSITKNPVAISIVDHIVRPRVPTRAVVVERLYQ